MCPCLLPCCSAHLNDDGDESVCATFFNDDTVITPLEETPIYNMLIKPKYPVNMQYVLDGMRARPIPAETASYGSKHEGHHEQASYTGKEDPIKVVVAEGDKCKIAQVIWGRVSITTKVEGETMQYVGTIYAVPELDMSSQMTMPMRRSASDDTSDIIDAMCADPVVKRAVPWAWEFDLHRVEASRSAEAAQQ